MCVDINSYYSKHTCLFCICVLILIPVGADPIVTDSKPEYMPRNPPDFKNPCSLCNRVLMVSNGNNEISTDTPAAAPAYKRKYSFYKSIKY